MNCKVGVKRIDAVGRDFNDDIRKNAKDITLSYLKLINVPCMFDIGCV